jgi:hypothetical protein
VEAQRGCAGHGAKIHHVCACSDRRQTTVSCARGAGNDPASFQAPSVSGIDCWQWSTKEYGGFVVETVLPAVASNIASLGLDVEQLLDWLDKQNAIIPHTIVGKASDHQQSTYAIAIGGKASDPVTYGHVSPWYQQHLHAIAIGNWSKSNIPIGYLPKKCLVRAIVQARWSGRRAAWLAACCQI